MKRSRKSQTKHDTKVISIARKLERQGFEVKADVRGYEQPDIIRGFWPNVVGTKGRQRKIHEVETKDSQGFRMSLIFCTPLKAVIKKYMCIEPKCA
ncbi:MAG: hypothetical protein COV72_01710 [Candidatus Omnitrophica bacterium CG11_big_fil_rev_8_21_14_0_20_42_13]|uniref:Uncharacterized protein n=1 Tax=Candidatus Ghiorseimicrobium undicola TaxID=1974746 RepID=A0A2H0LZA5_9BACT|nr:MAG: hypothetical protein COV72_01710 [Candidatus Omnitrophica bacterium CG11_big_fil_rev_8_21_14_0_20_42_13]